MGGNPVGAEKIGCPVEVLRRGGARPASEVMVTFIKARQRDPATQSARERRDDELRAAIQRVWDENEQVYGPRKMWKPLRREDHRVARGTVERVMRAMELRGD